MQVFLDTNILVYAYDTSDDAKHKAAVDLIARLLSEENVVISTQVLNEFVVVITGKVNRPSLSMMLPQSSINSKRILQSI